MRQAIPSNATLHSCASRTKPFYRISFIDYLFGIAIAQREKKTWEMINSATLTLLNHFTWECPEDQTTSGGKFYDIYLVRQPVLEKEITEFKPIKIHLNIVLVSHFAHSNGLINTLPISDFHMMQRQVMFNELSLPSKNKSETQIASSQALKLMVV